MKIDGSNLKNPNFDFSGMEQFWKIVSILEKDIEPTAEQWDSLFNTPGYKVLTIQEFSRDFFIKYFSLAFMPSKAEELRIELEKGGIKAEYLKHFVRVKNMKLEIKRQEKKLQSSGSLMADALNYAKEYLPEGMIEDYPLPPVSFVIFGNDARGYSPIVVDTLFSIDNGAYLPYLLGHEFHHFYRNKKLTFKFPNEKNADYNIIWTINQIQAEGIADQIDKKYLIFNGGPFEQEQWAKKYKEYLNASPNIIKEMDELLAEIADSSDNYNKISQKFCELVPMSGHPTGYYMTNLIIEKLGKRALIEQIGNPFAFFRLFNQAAKMKGNDYPIFHKKSINFLSQLEERYKITK